MFRLSDDKYSLSVKNPLNVLCDVSCHYLLDLQPSRMDIANKTDDFAESRDDVLRLVQYRRRPEKRCKMMLTVRVEINIFYPYDSTVLFNMDYIIEDVFRAESISGK